MFVFFLIVFLEVFLDVLREFRKELPELKSYLFFLIFST